MIIERGGKDERSDDHPGRSAGRSAGRSTGRSYVLHPILKRTQNRQTRTADACLEEAIGLAEAIDLDIAGAEIVTVGRIDAGRFIGKGQAQRIDATLNALGDVDLVVMDTSLSPIQQLSFGS